MKVKPRIQIRHVSGKVFYHAKNAYNGEYLIKFLGSFDINDLYKQMQRDKIICR